MVLSQIPASPSISFPKPPASHIQTCTDHLLCAWPGCWGHTPLNTSQVAAAQMKHPYDINEETEAGSHRVTKPIKLDPALPRCRQEGHGQGDRGPERSGDRLWVTQQSAEHWLEASSRHLGTSAPRLAPKKTKQISLSVLQRGSRSYQMGCGQHPRSCQHLPPCPSCLLPRAVFSGKGSSGSTQTLSPQGTRPPQAASPPAHPLPSNLDCHTERESA